MPKPPSGPIDKNSQIVHEALGNAFENFDDERFSAERTELATWVARLREVISRHVTNVRKCDVDHESYDEVFDVLLGSVTMLLNSPPFPIAELSRNDRERLVLISYFVQEFEVTRQAIRDGHFAKACAALKQDLETLTRIRAIKQGSDRPGCVPPIRYSPEGIRQFYGELNKFAHMSKPDLLSSYLIGPDNYVRGGDVSLPPHVADTLKHLQHLLAMLTLEITRESLFLFLDQTKLASPEAHLAIRHLVISTVVLQSISGSLDGDA